MSDPETVAEEQDSFDGYAVPPGRYDVPSRRGPKYFVTLGIWATVLAVGMRTT